jgi:hypothetical protein
MLRKLRKGPMTMSLEETAGQNHNIKTIKTFETAVKSKYLGTELCVLLTMHLGSVLVNNQPDA